MTRIGMRPFIVVGIGVFLIWFGLNEVDELVGRGDIMSKDFVT